MWDEQDVSSRWVQGICAVFLAVFSVGGLYMVWNSGFFMLKFGGIALCCGAIRLCWRCAKYAATGRDNINRDNF
jgi:hypothetical protein